MEPITLTTAIKESDKILLEENDNALADYRMAKQQQIEKLKRLIPYLHMFSPKERKMIEMDMQKYGINPKG